MINFTNYLAEMWSPTAFGLPELDAYALKNMEPEIRSGIRALCLVFFILLVGSAVLNNHLQLGWPYLYTYSIMAAISFQLFWSAKKIEGINALYLLGTTLLVVSSTSFVLLAHKTGAFTPPLFISIVLVFMIIPLVPWGLKESFKVIGLIYLVFTLSSWSVQYRFSMDHLLLLQFLLTASGSIALSIVGRNTVLRRKEIRNLYELELTKKNLQKLSYKDPLTGAWNRRYLKTRYEEERQYHLMHGKSFYFVIFDVDEFKSLNDRNGHNYGDQVLQLIVASYQKHLGHHDVLIRMGGDEFALISSCDEPEKLIKKGLDSLSQAMLPDKNDSTKVCLSFGMVRVPPHPAIPFKEVYLASDRALYKAKERTGNQIVEEPVQLPAKGKSLFLQQQCQECA